MTTIPVAPIQAGKGINVASLRVAATAVPQVGARKESLSAIDTSTAPVPGIQQSPLDNTTGVPQSQLSVASVASFTNPDQAIASVIPVTPDQVAPGADMLLTQIDSAIHGIASLARGYQTAIPPIAAAATAAAAGAAAAGVAGTIDMDPVAIVYEWGDDTDMTWGDDEAMHWGPTYV